jgi:hypothetical protein
VKYLKIGISGPYINSERTEYHEVPDDYDPEGADSKDADSILENAVWEYVDAWMEVVDEDDVPEDER